MLANQSKYQTGTKVLYFFGGAPRIEVQPSSFVAVHLFNVIPTIQANMFDQNDQCRSSNPQPIAQVEGMHGTEAYAARAEVHNGRQCTSVSAVMSHVLFLVSPQTLPGEM